MPRTILDVYVPSAQQDALSIIQLQCDAAWVDGQIVKRHGELLADTETACNLMQVASSKLHERIAADGGFALVEEETNRRLMAVAGGEHGQYDFTLAI